MNEEKKLVPKLRFPEFREAEGWKGVPLSELVSALDAGVSVNSGDRPATGNEIGSLKTSAVTNGVFEPQENKVVFDEVERGRVKEPVQGGTIIISRMNTPALVGANAYVETSLENIYLPDRLWAAKSKLGTSMRFVASILGSDKGRAALSKLAKGSSGSMKNITKPDVLAFLIEAPSPAEQRKIADCLSSLDELIAAQARKVDALKTHKKGLMQKLFPIEGETQPRLRFPEFRNAGGWKKDALKGLCIRIMDGTHFSPKSKKGLRPYLTSKNIKEGRIDLSNLSYISEAEHAEIYSKCPVLTGDVLLTKDGANTGNCAINNLDFEFSLLSSVAVLRSNPSKLHQNFLYQSILSDSIQSLITESMAGQAITRITLAKIGGFEIFVTSLVEQQRIADCLTSLDDVITAATQELETLKTHKKGLMQQLFPSAETVES